MASSSCSLCNKVAPADKRRRKKLFGDACTSARSILAKLCSVPLSQAIPEPSKAILCYTCDKLLVDIYILEKKIEKQKNVAFDLINKFLHACQSEPRSTTLTSTSTSLTGKRLHSDSESDVSEFPSQFPRLSGADQSISKSLPTENDTSHIDQHKTRLNENPEANPLAAVHVLPGQFNPSQSKPSPPVEVKITYKKGPRIIRVNTPSRKTTVKRIARKSYVAMASGIIQSPTQSKNIVDKVALVIRKEMSNLASVSSDSILYDTIQAIKLFSWETIFLELERKTPTLVTLLKKIAYNKESTKVVPLVSFIASLLLKCKHQRLCLAQRAISVMLYGHGTAKQVFTNLQPLNVCLSHVGTINIIKKLCQDHTIEVEEWRDKLAAKIPKPIETEVSRATRLFSQIAPDDLGLEDDFNDDDSDDSVLDAPIYSPVSPSAELEEDTITDGNEDVDDQFIHEDSISRLSDIHDNDEVDVGSEDKYDDVDCWYGYKIVGDNVDKRVKPRYQRCDKQGYDFHHFHGYAVKDRVNMLNMSDEEPSVQTPDPNNILPSSNDISVLKSEFCILVSRILLEHNRDQFQGQEVQHHIPSEYSKQMAMKSITVPLGVILRNENKLDEMGEILDEYMKLVPTLPATGHYCMPNSSVLEYDDTRFNKILIGGDYLTAVRIRGAQALRSTETKAVNRLAGFIPVIEDWHSRMTYMKVIWSRLYTQKSAMEKGTMYQLKNSIGRSSIPNDPEKDMNSAEDFLLLMVHSHVNAAARVLQMESPISSIHDLAELLVNRFIQLPTTNESEPNATENKDGVQQYANEVLTLGILWHGFHDAIKEGDGLRIIRYWKILVIIFKSTAHKNYAKESINLLYHYNYRLSDRQKNQLIWSRTVNTQGGAGHNIPCDLFMEHLNKRLKSILRGMGSNITPERVMRAGRSIQSVHKICETFAKQTTGNLLSSKHPYPTFERDFHKVFNILVEQRSFEQIPGRNFSSFKFKTSLLHTYTRQQLNTKVQNTLKQLL